MLTLAGTVKRLSITKQHAVSTCTLQYENAEAQLVRLEGQALWLCQGHVCLCHSGLRIHLAYVCLKRSKILYAHSDAM